MEWKTIDTAPKNTSILIYAPDADYNRNIYVGIKSDKGYFWLVNSDCQTGCGNTGTPTHFMLLPKPPVLTQPKQ